jgi:hypothetical protein
VIQRNLSCNEGIRPLGQDFRLSGQDFLRSTEKLGRSVCCGYTLFFHERPETAPREAGALTGLIHVTARHRCEVFDIVRRPLI